MTAQIEERLVVDGREVLLLSEPPLPLGHPRLIEVPREEAVRSSAGILFSTACWRGYQGSWAIVDGRLFLTGVAGSFRLEGDAPLPATWFSGSLRIAWGDLVRYEHIGFASRYEHEELLTVRKGVVIDRRPWDRGDATSEEE